MDEWKNYWSRSTFANIIVKIKVARLYGPRWHGVYSVIAWWVSARYIGYSRCNHGNGAAGGVAWRVIWDESQEGRHTGSTATASAVKFISFYFARNCYSCSAVCLVNGDSSFIFRRHRCYRSVVCSCVYIVCLSVTLVRPAKAVGRNEMLFGRDTLVVTSNIVLHGASVPPLKWEIWGSEPRVCSDVAECHIIWPLFILFIVYEWRKQTNASKLFSYHKYPTIADVHLACVTA